MRPRHVFELFYLATPIFAAVDIFLGVPARAAGIQEPTWRLLYYGFLSVCWLVCRRWPDAAPLVGIGECTVNLLLLLLSILIPVWTVTDQLLADGSAALALGAGTWWNVAISGPMLIYGIRSNERAILDRWSPSRQGSARPEAT